MTDLMFNRIALRTAQTLLSATGFRLNPLTCSNKQLFKLIVKLIVPKSPVSMVFVWVYSYLSKWCLSGCTLIQANGVCLDVLLFKQMVFVWMYSNLSKCSLSEFTLIQANGVCLDVLLFKQFQYLGVKEQLSYINIFHTPNDVQNMQLSFTSCDLSIM